MSVFCCKSGFWFCVPGVLSRWRRYHTDIWAGGVAGLVVQWLTEGSRLIWLFYNTQSLAILILQFLKGMCSFGFWSKCCVCWICWFQRFLLILKCAFLNYPFLSLCDWAVKGSLAKILTTSAAQHCRNGFPGECAVPSLLDAPSYVTSSSVMKGSEIWRGPSEFFVCFSNR